MMAKTLGKIAAILALTVLVSGCGLGRTENKPAESVAVSSYVVLERDEEAIRNRINDYFLKMYSMTPASYASNSASGEIPQVIRELVVKKTIDEGNGNPEVGIHLPRFIEVNGYTAVNYTIVTEKDSSREVPFIKADFIGRNGDNYIYFVKIDLKAKCLPNNIFEACYKRDPINNTYTKTGEPDASLAEDMRIQAKYDVEVAKEGSSFKIVKATETANQYGYKNRLLKLNNGFVTRLNYLNLDKNQEGDYANKADGERYEKEKAVIGTFFENLKELNSDRMGLLKQEWNKGLQEFLKFMEKTGASKDKDAREILDPGTGYRNTFDLKSFPLKPGMQKIAGYGKITVTPHPAYGENNRKYIVSLEANIEKINGASGITSLYKYDYFVTLSGNNDYLKISSIKLNGYFNAD